MLTMMRPHHSLSACIITDLVNDEVVCILVAIDSNSRSFILAYTFVSISLLQRCIGRQKSSKILHRKPPIPKRMLQTAKRCNSVPQFCHDRCFPSHCAIPGYSLKIGLSQLDCVHCFPIVDRWKLPVNIPV